VVEALVTVEMFLQERGDDSLIIESYYNSMTNGCKCSIQVENA